LPRSLGALCRKTWGQDSYAGRALKEFERRRAATTEVATGDEEIIIYSLRGQWLVGIVHKIREAMLIAVPFCELGLDGAAELFRAARCRLAAELPQPLLNHGRLERLTNGPG
jgi:hypothetical protein